MSDEDLDSKLPSTRKYSKTWGYKKTLVFIAACEAEGMKLNVIVDEEVMGSLQKRFSSMPGGEVHALADLSRKWGELRRGHRHNSSSWIYAPHVTGLVLENGVSDSNDEEEVEQSPLKAATTGLPGKKGKKRRPRLEGVKKKKKKKLSFDGAKIVMRVLEGGEVRLFLE